MLQKLYVKDYILIDEVDLSFDNGFSVFTGETGAGKSIFIDCVKSCDKLGLHSDVIVYPYGSYKNVYPQLR